MIRFDRASVACGGQLVVEAVSLQVRAGEAWALIGASGAGKSMLLAAAATAVRLHAGDILVHGHSVRRDGEMARMATGYVPDRMPEWPRIRVGEFLELFAAASGRRGKELAQSIEKGLSLAGLARRNLDPVNALDAGHAKRLLIARAMLHDPQVLLLDDPFSALDPAARRDLEQLISDAGLMGRSVVTAIDDARVSECFTHVAVLSEGRLVAAGTNDPATFAEGRRWRFLLRCPSQAEECVSVLHALPVKPLALDADTAIAWLDLAVVSPSGIVATIVRAGIPIESAAFDPPWQAQLVDDDVPPY